ncbi:hypothetical protein NC651_025152 [Populus alba x Populus x berolinensis]|nr:hypothetical protein NC651_025152 [Populus alba x Populus x berolinensis]
MNQKCYFMVVKVYVNLIFCLNFHIFTSLGPSSLDILHGHSKATMLLICNNAAQGILSSFFFKYADTILKKYSSTVATIFTGIASAVLFGHTLTMNFILGISIVFISMHQVNIRSGIYFIYFAHWQAAWGTRQEGEEENGVREREYFPVWILGLHDTVYHIFFSSFHHFRRLRMSQKMVVWKWLIVRTARGWFSLFAPFPFTICELFYNF